MNTNHFALPANVELGDYRILRLLGQGGFGITYLAENISDGHQVVIKENLPAFCAYRDTHSLIVAPTNPNDADEEYPKLLTRFVEEARLLARLDHPNIVKVYTAFEALGTAYYVMPWVGGKELHKVAPAPHDITETWLLPILRKLLEALEYLHSQNIYHRDIKPANILLENETTPVIIDFGTARSIISERSATMVGSPGYSPIEQITARGQRGPWTDIYSLGATCYRLITGSPPPEANERLADEEDPLRPLANRADLRSRFSNELLATIDKALALRAKNRWQTASEWLSTLPVPAAINTAGTADAPATVNTRPINVAPSTGKKKRLLFIPLLFLLASGLVVGGYQVNQMIEQARAQRLLEEEARKQEQEQRQREEEARKQEQEQRQREEEAKRQAEMLHHYQEGENHYLGNNGYVQNFEKAVHHFQIAAMAGNSTSQWYLGKCYYNGEGVEHDIKQATTWFKKAAEQGLTQAQFDLGVCYECDYDNPNEATIWFRKAAEQGLANAQYNLGDRYEHGYGVDKDLSEAIYWYKKAAEQGVIESQFILAECYKNGYCLPKDLTEAAKWYEKAAKQGYPEAQYNLGVCYYYGRGVSKNYKDATSWFRKAAEKNNAYAQYSLGFCYEEGLGVPKNKREAANWYRKAANQGHEAAKKALKSLR